VTSNAEAAERFRAIADLLDVLGERFKPEAYRRAARTIESLPEELAAVARRDALRTLPGVGEAIAEKIREYLSTGTIAYYEKLRREVPPGVVDLLKLPGLGPKTARRFWLELGVDGPEALRTAIDAGRLEGVAGFKDRKIELLRQALAPGSAGSPGRLPLDAVYPLAHRLLDGLRRSAPVDRAEIAGSFRRGRETVGDLDLLVTSTAPERVFDAFQALPEVGEVKLRGPTKSTVLLANGLQADLRVVEPEEFGAALQYFTGSKDHNVLLRSLAREMGLKVNEYGVFRGETRTAGRTEEEVYGALGVRWIPPELREGRDEIDRARRGPIPPLVDASDLVGELHLHLAEEAGPDAAERLLQACRARRLAYVAVVVAGRRSDGTSWELPPATLAALSTPSGAGTRALLAEETGWDAASGEGEGRQAAYRILRPAGVLPSGRVPPAGPPVLLLGHLAPAAEAGGRSSEIGLARRWRMALEIGPGAERLDPSSGQAAREAGVPLAIPTGVGAPPDDPLGPVALAFARRAAARPKDVANARDPPGGVSAGGKGGRRSR
jgi:DNA polymerase/3'-5' exonuclease PolX